MPERRSGPHGGTDRLESRSRQAADVPSVPRPVDITTRLRRVARVAAKAPRRRAASAVGVAVLTVGGASW